MSDRLTAVSVAGLAALAAVFPVAPAQGGGRAAGSALYVTQVTLTGKAEKPRGEAAGIGSVTICVDQASSSISFGFDRLFLSARPTAGHVHRGSAGVNGPVVHPFEVPGSIDPLVGDVQWYGTGPASKATIAALVASPGKHYVNVHTKRHPNGAVRGQLGSWRKVQADDPTAAVCGAG
jgi:CHRD domain-containing protein